MRRILATLAAAALVLGLAGCATAEASTSSVDPDCSAAAAPLAHGAAR
jgi:outer membrane lipopolysaccharide assembly protein LptE/RlpB